MNPPETERDTLQRRLILFGLALGFAACLYFTYPAVVTHSARSSKVMDWLRQPQDHSDWAVQAGEVCPGAPFGMPTDGYIGYLWGDSFRPGHSHQGLDIFGGEDPGVTPVYAAYNGYLTREAGWKSSLIIRLPNDPVQPGRQIWLYYTHLADSAGNSYIVSDFPPGTEEAYVEAGTLLGYQGNYSGDPNNPVGVHLHISIVQDDGSGDYLNELEIKNTYDPSPYFGMPLNGPANLGRIPHCLETEP